ncbi:MAG TPA: hypothetical protein VK908_11525 [Jiangellales bacterium]|nr:hypothetical protein [Jiangellales bacterium]
MTTSLPGRGDPRAALDVLVGALRQHLEACEHSSGEGDPQVQAAYTALREAADRYDDALFEAHDEVTPWEFAAAGLVDAEYEGEDVDTGRITVLVRRDYELADRARLLAAGRAAYAEAFPSDPVEAATADVTHPGRALYQMLHAYGVDGFDDAAEAAGLTTVGGTVWVQSLDPDDEPLDDEDPFAVADPDLLVYRLDEVVAEPPPS